MGAANLATSALVGRDQNGSLIGAVVRAGLPSLQTSMPQYSDYADRQIADLAAYIHHQRRYKELIAAKDAGDAISAVAISTGRETVGRVTLPNRNSPESPGNTTRTV